MNPNNQKNSKSTVGRTFSIRKDGRKNATTDENAQNDVHGFEDENDHVQPSLSIRLSSSSDDNHGDDDSQNRSRIQSRQDALERFLQFSLGRDDEESYWLRRM